MIEIPEWVTGVLALAVWTLSTILLSKEIEQWRARRNKRTAT